VALAACDGSSGGGAAAGTEIDPEGTFRYVFVQNP
jgi:hypothetical protein